MNRIKKIIFGVVFCKLKFLCKVKELLKEENNKSNLETLVITNLITEKDSSHTVSNAISHATRRVKIEELSELFSDTNLTLWYRDKKNEYTEHIFKK